MAEHFVLVHGAWQSAATWDLVRPRLEQAGCVVSVPELTGLEKSASLTPEVDLATHVEDVARLVRATSGNVTLVGHSYAGMIITGVAEQARNMARLIYVDAFIPLDGQCVLDLLPAPITAMFRQAAQAAGDGWRLPAGESQLDSWGLPPGAARDFVRARLTDFSLRCFEQRLPLPNNAAAALPRTYVAATAEAYPARPVFEPFAAKAAAKDGLISNLPQGMTATSRCRKPLSNYWRRPRR